MSGVNDKLFYINLSELEDRLDPLFYVAIKKMQKEVVERAKYECIDLIKACSINRGRFGHRPRNDPRFYGGEYPFIQTGDIVKASTNNDSIQYTQTLNELGLGTSKLFQPPKLLFTIAANIGDTAILDYPSCFPDSIVALIPHDDKLSLEYLNIYLKHIKPYIEALAPYSAQKNLNNQQLAQIPLIVPPSEIQELIVSKIDEVYRLKKQKEAESKVLLESIDTYLLNELGIELAEYDNGLESRIFTVNLSDITGRLDPDYNSKISYLDDLNWNYPLVELGDLLKQSPQYGANEEAKKMLSNNDVRYIRITDIDTLGNLKEINMKTASTISKQYILNTNDILFARSGSVGRCYIHRETEKKSIFAGYLIRFILNQDLINPNYLFYYCHSSIYKYWVSAIERPAVQSNINSEEYKSLKIPLPPIEKQNEIAQYIQEMRDQAKQLQEEAKEVLESAKREVEEMILGE